VRLLVRFFVLIPALVIAAPLMGQRITVESADPSSTEQGTTLNVTIRGRGFSAGATSRFLVTQTNDTGRVTVNHTSYINSTTLVANVTAADDAVISFYDIAVTASGRTGKGIEKFSVQRKKDETINPIVLGPPEGCEPGQGHAMVMRLNNGADLASLRFPMWYDPCDDVLHLWAGTRWEVVDLIPGLTGAFGRDVSDDGTLVGYGWCIDSNGSCGPTEAFFKRDGQPSELLPGTGLPSSHRDAAAITSDGRQIVGNGSEGMIVWTWDAPSAEWIAEVVGNAGAEALSDDGNVIVGSRAQNNRSQARIWFRAHGGEPFAVFDGPVNSFANDVTPSGLIVVGTYFEERCENRRCTKKSSREVPVYWRRSATGDWIMKELSPIYLSSGAPLGCGAWGVSDVAGKGPVAIGRCGFTAVAWLPDGSGGFGAPITLPAADASASAATFGINKHGWILGVTSTLDGERAILWKLP